MDGFFSDGFSKVGHIQPLYIMYPDRAIFQLHEGVWGFVISCLEAGVANY